MDLVKPNAHKWKQVNTNESELTQMETNEPKWTQMDLVKPNAHQWKQVNTNESELNQMHTSGNKWTQMNLVKPNGNKCTRENTSEHKWLKESNNSPFVLWIIFHFQDFMDCNDIMRIWNFIDPGIDDVVCTRALVFSKKIDKSTTWCLWVLS